MSTLMGKRVILTGASRGLGLALAAALAKAGADLALWARDRDALVRAQTLAEADRLDAGQAIRHYPVDLADLDAVERTTHQALADFGGSVDVVINNAAIQGPLGRFHNVDWLSWLGVFQVNLFAAARVCQLAIPAMRAQGRGKIINLSGGGATGPRPDVSAYGASKAALVRLSETLAEELREDHIDVNCVAPGAMNTRMLTEVLAAGPGGVQGEYERAQRQAESGGTPPENAAEVVVWLASEASDGITGRLISAVWDDWARLGERREALAKTDVYTLRRIVPKDRGLDWG
jgi:3-oxoacyl-[acyl-carrier protein] reductase